MELLIIWLVCGFLAGILAYFIGKEIEDDFTFCSLFMIVFSFLLGIPALISNIIVWFIICGSDITIFKRK